MSKAVIEAIEKLRAQKIRNIPVKCISGQHLFLSEGEYGLASAEEIGFNRAFIKPVQCDDFDMKAYAGHGPIKKKAKANAQRASEQSSKEAK